MKIPNSSRDLYEEIRPNYETLKKKIDDILVQGKQSRWHYESRIKELASYALKLETGRERHPEKPEDFFACTLVVENQTKFSEAKALVKKHFTIESRRPKSDHFTHKTPFNFEFDDLRLYVRLQPDATQKPGVLDDLLFEVQIKTFLQHAWGIATHDLVYKTGEANWARSRIAHQVKAMLEHSELAIGQADALAVDKSLAKSDGPHKSLNKIIKGLKQRWPPERLPKDQRRLAECVLGVAALLNLGMEEIWKCLDASTKKGRGTEMLHLSPFASIVDSLLTERDDVFVRLSTEFAQESRNMLFITNEIELPNMDELARKKLVLLPSRGSA